MGCLFKLFVHKEVFLCTDFIIFVHEMAFLCTDFITFVHKTVFLCTDFYSLIDSIVGVLLLSVIEWLRNKLTKPTLI